MDQFAAAPGIREDAVENLTAVIPRRRDLTSSATNSSFFMEEPPFNHLPPRNAKRILPKILFEFQSNHLHSFNICHFVLRDVVVPRHAAPTPSARRSPSPSAAFFTLFSHEGAIAAGCRYRRKDMNKFSGTAIAATSNCPARPDEKPAHPVWVDGFWMDSTKVTNAQFVCDVDATGYVYHHAERPPKLEDIMAQLPPGTRLRPRKALSPELDRLPAPDSVSNMQDISSQWWTLAQGCRLTFTEAPTPPSTKDDYPVVQVSYDDALALRNPGRHAPPHGGRVGIRPAPRWHGRRTLRLGRQTYRPRERHPAREYLAGHLPHHRHRQGPLQGSCPREILFLQMDGAGVCRGEWTRLMRAT